MDSGSQQVIDVAKFYFISWAMPFFYVSAFYFIMRYGLQNAELAKVFRKMLRIFWVQISIIFVYEIYHFSVSLVLEDQSFRSLISQFSNKYSLENVLGIFSSGNSTPAYFLAQVFFLYFPLFLLGRFIGLRRYYSVITIACLILMYSLNFENSFITIDSYVYLAISIFLLKIDFQRIELDFFYKTVFLLSLLFLITWRMYHQEFLLIVLAIWASYSLLYRSTKTNLMAVRLSRFGSSHSLFVFLFHALSLSLSEILVSNLDIRLANRSFSDLFTYALINILAFVFTAFSAITLNRRFGWTLKI